MRGEALSPFLIPESPEPAMVSCMLVLNECILVGGFGSQPPAPGPWAVYKSGTEPLTSKEPALPPEPARAPTAPVSSSDGLTINGTGSLNHSDDSNEPGDFSATRGQEAMPPSESPLSPVLVPQSPSPRTGQAP